MILAAGLGNRLRPLTCLVAKPAVPFLNRPLIRYSMELFAGCGVEELAVNLHHLPESVRRAVEPGPLPVVYSHETQILGTGGGIGAMREFLGSETFLVSNGKIFLEDDLRPALDFHWRSKAQATMVLVPYRPGDGFNPVFLNESSEIIGFGRGRAAAAPQDAVGRFVFTGVHIFEPQVLELIPSGMSDIIDAVYERLIVQARLPVGYVSRGFWCECSTSRRYLEKSLEVLRRRGLLNLGPAGTGSADSIVGDSAKVPGSTQLGRCIVWDGVELAEDCRHWNSIFAGPLSGLPPGRSFENVVVVPRGPETEAGAVEIPAPEHTFVEWPLTS